MSATAGAALLAAADDHRHQAHPRLAADVERTDALGAVDLVSGDAHEIDVHRLDIERDLAGSLGRARSADARSPHFSETGPRVSNSAFKAAVNKKK